MAHPALQYIHQVLGVRQVLVPSNVEGRDAGEVSEEASAAPEESQEAAPQVLAGLPSSPLVVLVPADSEESEVRLLQKILEAVKHPEAWQVEVPHNIAPDSLWSFLKKSSAHKGLVVGDVLSQKLGGSNKPGRRWTVEGLEWLNLPELCSMLPPQEKREIQRTKRQVWQWLQSFLKSH